VVLYLAPDGLGLAKSLTGKNHVVIVANLKQSAPYFGEFLLRALRSKDITLTDAFNHASAQTILWYQNQYVEKDVPGVLVHGKDFQELFHRFYPDKKLRPGDDLPRKANNDMNVKDAYHGRRVLLEIAGLED